MSNVNYNLVVNEDTANITVVVDGTMYTADNESHPNIKAIIQAAIEGDPDVVRLFDAAEDITRQFDRLTDRVSIDGDTVLLDNDPAPEAISDAILRHYREGEDFESLVNFLEKLANNPSHDSIEQLYPWLQAHEEGFTITSEGDLVAYKGVVDDGDSYRSISHGKAIVNGQVVTGQIPNYVGAVVEMPRSEVTANSAVGCSTGLHAGTWGYADNFAQGAVLEVRIDPRDVVSVPSDCDAQKLRTCRYTVVGVIDRPYTTSVRHDDLDDEFDEDFDDEDDLDEDDDLDEYRWGDGEDEPERTLWPFHRWFQN